MDKLYARISKSTKHVLYQYMKDNNISLLNYSFNYFFQYCIQKYQIQVISHHFSNHKIEGLTVADELGISFSYERENPKVKQNFTLCHELGHFMLKHDGNYFSESIDNQENLLEREANIFSAVILMPDIVLLSKIYFSYDTFDQVQNSLEVSKQALFFRLLDFLREHYPDKDSEIKQAVEAYIEGKNASIFRLFHDIREQIIKEFHQFQPSLINQVKQRVSKVGFVTSQEYPNLLNQDNWKAIKDNNGNLKTWLVYNKGKSIAYVWDKEKFSDEEARKKAELELLLM
ncbi:MULTISPECIES: ImmA/IrrE family metallo-endopeptidase [Streptococcus]|uniref:ImmA/IrrE family metallo-endopeptidase n=1 Tax=Streptococcus salivarius TaxID=1304 RepID=A0A6A8UBV6_STRSL|nr:MULTISPECIES: ImmA/IrrE family metallo-endopeptidase [Streptococcus]MTQ89658.1 ImmA/IrrE family metallo-endopeptidase [Streptococcus salivarius]MTR27386.1 ImmA/IrrE family metallo-endopeptidase [Streptococcus salivarius]MTR38812.1 ImmA/IrrE family metallo-endopeptidase [Streptococcus salivarius]